MGYMLIIDHENNTIEVHSDMCDIVFEKKDNIINSNSLEFTPFNFFAEIKDYLENISDYEVFMCDICKPEENSEELDEDYDDFYEEFEDDDEIDDTRCDII